MSLPKISIIILNWNGLNHTVQCLESLKKISYPNYEIILVDNGSDNNEGEVLKNKYKDYIRLIKIRKNRGFAGGNNIAIQKVIEEKKSKYILFLNNDTIVKKDFLEKLVEEIERNERIGIVSPKILKIDNPKIIDSTGLVFRGGILADRGEGEIEKGQYDKKTEIIGASGAALFCRIKLFEEIGLFKKEFSGYDDGEFCWRAWKNGWKAKFVPSAVIYHHRSVSTFKCGNPKIVLEYERKFFDSSIKVLNLYGSWLNKIKFLFSILIEISINLIKVLLNWRDKEKRKRIILSRIECLKRIKF